MTSLAGEPGLFQEAIARFECAKARFYHGQDRSSEALSELKTARAALVPYLEALFPGQESIGLGAPEHFGASAEGD